MKDDFKEDNFSGVDWDGNGHIDWYDYEIDREVYQQSFGSSGRKDKKSKKKETAKVNYLGLLILVIVSFVMLFIYKPVGIGMWIGIIGCALSALRDKL